MPFLSIRLIFAQTPTWENEGIFGERHRQIAKMPFALQKDLFKAWYRLYQEPRIGHVVSQSTVVALDERPISIGLTLPFVLVNKGRRQFLYVGKDEESVVGFYGAPYSGWEHHGQLSTLPRAADFFDIENGITKQQMILCDLYSSKKGYKVVFLHCNDAVSSDDTFVYYSVVIINGDSALLLTFTDGEVRDPIDVASSDFANEWIRGC